MAKTPAEYQRAYRERHPERIKAARARHRKGAGRTKYLNTLRNASLRRNYGITADEYNALFDLQNGLCFICKTACPSFSNLSVDHDHQTGKVRGLLCKPCNTGLGAFKDNPELLQIAITYLEANRGN